VVINNWGCIINFLTGIVDQCVPRIQFFEFQNEKLLTLGWTACTDSQSVPRTGQHEHRCRAGIHLRPEWDSKSRAQCSSDTPYTSTASADMSVCLVAVYMLIKYNFLIIKNRLKKIVA
jgi:hypothetical protein